MKTGYVTDRPRAGLAPVRLVRAGFGAYHVAMWRSAILVVLALLMVFPSGVCACGATEHACPDHPTSVADADEAADSAGVAHDHRTIGPDSTHRCPPPSPHRPNCPSVSTAMADKASPSSSPTVALEHPVEPLFLDWVTTTVAKRPGPVDLVRPSAPPLYLAHCVLII